MLGDKSNVGGYALNGGSTKAGLVGCREVLMGQGRGMVSQVSTDVVEKSCIDDDG